jgi:exopolysaccharide biosynthesis WecB/TagA/CpsF family protein
MAMFDGLPSNASPRSFLGLGFHPMATDEAARCIAAQGRLPAPFAYVVTPNVDHVVRLELRPDLRPLYARAWLTLNDSRILELFAGFTRLKLPAAPGSDVVEALFARHIGAHDPVTVIGGSADTIQALRQRYRLSDIRWFDAPHGLKDDAAARAACVDFIVANPSPFVFLAVGSPQQEMIAAECAVRGTATGVGLCCGASLEFLSGETARAPRWVRAARLESLHRLAADPVRLWRRYLVDGPRILLIWMKWRATAQA